jgi:hypothetical protein
MLAVNPEDKLVRSDCGWLGTWAIPLMVEDGPMGFWAWIGFKYGGVVVIS